MTETFEITVLCSTGSLAKARKALNLLAKFADAWCLNIEYSIEYSDSNATSLHKVGQIHFRLQTDHQGTLLFQMALMRICQNIVSSLRLLRLTLIDAEGVAVVDAFSD